MYPNTVTLLILSYILYKLVNNKLVLVNAVYETIFMDGMPQVSASINPWGGCQYYRTSVVNEASSKLFPNR